jgi:hypothetical protein
LHDHIRPPHGPPDAATAAPAWHVPGGTGGGTARLRDLLTVWDGALCAQVDPELFFPEKGDRAARRAARRVCGRCAVQDPCARVFGPLLTHGVVGGLTERQRARRRRRALRAAA